MTNYLSRQGHFKPCVFAGVMLDYDSAMLSFFDGASGRHFHTFRMSTFERGLRPAFSIGNKSLTINTGITIPDHLRLDSRC